MAESSELGRDKSAFMKEMDAIKGAPASPKHITPPAGFTLLHVFEGWSRGEIWSPDGTLLAFTGSGGTIQLWNPINSRFLNLVKDLGSESPKGTVEAWSPDGKLLTLDICTMTMHLWDPATEKLLHTLESYALWSHLSVAWSPDGTLLAVVGYEEDKRPREDEPGYEYFTYGGVVEVWDAIHGVLLHTFENPEGSGDWPRGRIGSVGWSSDSRWLAFVSESGECETKVRLWNLTKGMCSLECLKDVQTLAWSPSGKLLAIIGTYKSDAALWLWDSTSGVLQQVPYVHVQGYYAHRARRLAWSPDGKLLASYGYYDGEVLFWDLTGGWQRPHPRPLESTYWRDDPYTAAWSPDGQRLAIAGTITLQLWERNQEWNTTRPIRTLEDYTRKESMSKLRSLAWSPDGKLLAGHFYITENEDEFRSFDEDVEDMDICIWRADTGELLGVFTDLARGSRYAWHPSLPLLVTTGQRAEDLLIWQWDLDGLSHHIPSSDMMHSILPPTVTQAANNLVTNETGVRDLQVELEETSSKRATTQSNNERSQLERRIHELETVLQEKREENNQLRTQLEQQQGSFLRTEEHRAALEQAITEAKEELIIISPWLNPRVCDDALCRLIAQAVKRGVQVRIGYGFTERPGASDAVYHRANAMHIIRALNTAVKREGTFTSGGKLDIQRISDTHQKILICDRLYAILGSFNWLSYRGELDTEYRKETSIVLRDPSKVAELARVALHMWPS